MIKEIRLIILLCGFVTISCTNEGDKGEKIIKDSLSGFDDYQDVYLDVCSQLNGQIRDSLCDVERLIYNPWHFDSVMFFNENNTAFVGFLVIQDTSVSVLDYLEEIIGVKIDGQWKVLNANNVTVLPRENYKTQIYEPMTLSQISMLGRESYSRKRFSSMKDGVSSYILRPVGCDDFTSSCIKDIVKGKLEAMSKCKHDHKEWLRHQEAFIKTHTKKEVQQPSFFSSKKRFD